MAEARRAFGVLIAAQAAHSVEEYFTRLYDVFAPARYVTGLVSQDRAAGFLLVNAAFVAFGIWCYLVPARGTRARASAWMWPWVVVELANGVGHTALAIANGGYFSGAVTGVVLLAAAAWLGRLLARTSSTL